MHFSYREEGSISFILLGSFCIWWFWITPSTFRGGEICISANRHQLNIIKQTL